jgi:hypothetical protein
MQSMMQFELVAHQVDEQQPLIYMWEIHDANGILRGRYVGKAKRGTHRPLKHYQMNVRRILQGQPYRKNKPDGFRRVHRALAHAQCQGWHISLDFLCNVGADEDINQLEQHYIMLMNAEGPDDWQLNGRQSLMSVEPSAAQLLISP